MKRGRIFQEVKIRQDAQQIGLERSLHLYLAGGCFDGVCLGEADHLGTNP